MSIIREATTDYVRKLADPALMTYREYYKLVNPEDKYHPSAAYESDVESLNKWDHNKKDLFPKLIRRIKINGITFEFRLQTEDRFQSNYYKTNPETGMYLRDENDQLIPYTREEVERGMVVPHSRRYRYAIGVFTEEDGYVGGSQDEWGCMLIRVADEFRGFGLGPIIGKMARTLEPRKSSGGFTPQGSKNFFRVYQEFVREYARSGMYSFLVKSGQITAERAKVILDSAKLHIKTSREAHNLNTNDPSDWLLYVGGYGDFIIYDRKLLDIIDDQKLDRWAERMIRGMVYVAVGRGFARIKALGGVNPKIKGFMITLAAAHAKAEGVPLAIELEDMAFIDRSKIEIENDEPTWSAGYESHLVRFKGDVPDLNELGLPERMFRKKHDRYDEFKNKMIELAYATYR